MGSTPIHLRLDRICSAIAAVISRGSWWDMLGLQNQEGCNVKPPLADVFLLCSNYAAVNDSVMNEVSINWHAMLLWRRINVNDHLRLIEAYNKHTPERSKQIINKPLIWKKLFLLQYNHDFNIILQSKVSTLPMKSNHLDLALNTSLFRPSCICSSGKIDLYSELIWIMTKIIWH